MGRGIQHGRIPAGGVPSVRAMAYTTGQTFKKGALLTIVAAGTVSECAADPTAVCGVSLQGAGTGPGYNMADNPSNVTGRTQEVSVCIADRMSEFTIRGVNGGTDPVTPLQTHIGESYGVAKVGDDWVLDLAETSAKVFEIVDIIPEKNLFVVKFLEAVIQTP